MIGERAVDTVVLMDADVPSAVALAALREEREIHLRARPEATAAGPLSKAGAKLAIMEMPWLGEPARAVHSAVRRIAEVHGLVLLEAGFPEAGITDRGTVRSPGTIETIGLLNVASAAAAAGFSRVVWPATAGVGEGVDIDRAAAIMDRAMLCGRLVAIDAIHHGCPGIHIETPYADLSDTQMADLALDMAVPLESCWWWGGDADDAGANLARARWMPRLMEMGFRPDRS